MLFNSVDFFVFLPIVFILYWFILNKNVKIQNLLIICASYFFYGFWDWRFLFLIFASTIVDYFIGLKIHKSENLTNQKKWLWVSVIFNLGLLSYFKYFNFFIDSFIEMFTLFGYNFENSWTLKIILPVGISFYTFQTMSYSLDIYYKKLKPTKDFIAFTAFVSFFPQLVAGPIERASNLLPQILNKRTFSYKQSVDGLKLILWGLFKKVVIADSLGLIVDDIFNNYADYPSSTLLLGAVFFAFQIYGDFSGYSDVAIGTSKLFGIELMSNFKFPYFSRNIAEFWRRWHISLSTWLRDYLYIPLGGSKINKWISIRNIFAIFLISGFWHGANWTFIIWGGIHAIIFIPIFLLKSNRKFLNSTVADNSYLPSLKEIFQIITTFLLVTLSWVFFRAENVTIAFDYFRILTTDFSFNVYAHPSGYRMIDYFILILVFVIYEYIIRRDERSPFKFKSKIIRFIIYALIVFSMLLFYDDQINRSFIYFQF